ncbi:unnamed protein product [Linum tenue]|uniref:Uncharacterized protein n=1 Tax=Linum tenue TaxID=586396 RepID=A0AAV0KL12_9ROSI|nr:unnamed protein product [Linum tenue]
MTTTTIVFSEEEDPYRWGCRDGHGGVDEETAAAMMQAILDNMVATLPYRREGWWTVMGTTVAGLPRFVVLRSRRANRFGVWWVTATADNPNEDTSRVGECTLFEHVFVGNQINTVWFRYVPNQRRLTWFNNPAHPYLYRLSLVYSANPLYGDFYEFAPWESYEDRMRAKHYQIQTRDMEIQRLTAQVAARDEELRNLRRQLAHKDEVILDLKGRVAALKAYLEKRKAKLEYGMLTLHSTVTSAWESFQLNVACGIVRIAAGFEQILTLPAT